MGTTTLNRSLLVDTALAGIITDALGTNAGGVTSDADIGKSVKLGADAYVATALGDEIEGIISSVEHGTKNGGFNWGGIQTKGRAMATVGTSQTGTITVGGFVAADTQAAFGISGPLNVFDAGTGYVAPTNFMWRVIRIMTGTGVTGDTVMIEKI